MKGLTQDIIRIGIFMICAQVLLHLRPNGVYEKYMKVLVSMMILAQLFFPVMNFFMGEGEKMEDQVKILQEKMEESRIEALYRMREAEELMDRITEKELEKSLEETQEKMPESKEEICIEKSVIDQIKVEISMEKP